MTKQYGKERTALKLTDVAFKNYSNSDYTIYEEETDNEYTYTIDGGIYTDDLTEKDVNEFFEQLEEIEDTLEVILVNHPNDSIRIEDTIKRGEEWLEYYKGTDTLEETALLTSGYSDTYKYDLQILQGDNMEKYTLQEATLENRFSYKDVCVVLGGSDIATLIMVGMTMEDRPATTSHLDMKELSFGEDGEYSAWLIDGDTSVPEHYTLTAEFKNWLKIYDDEGYCTYFTAPFIRVYQAGQFGCLIQLCQEYTSIKKLKEMLKSDKRIIAEVMEEEVKRILNSDKTTYQIAKETGVSTAIIDNYRTGKSKIENMTMSILQKLICARTDK